MKFREMLALIREDYGAHERDWTRHGFRAVAVHRLGNWRMAVRSRLLRAPLSMLYRVAYRRCRNVYGMDLPYTVELGRRVVVEHQGGIVIHGWGKIGDDWIIRQNCTLGIRSLDRSQDAPVLAARANVRAGAVLLGAIAVARASRLAPMPWCFRARWPMRSPSACRRASSRALELNRQVARQGVRNAWGDDF